MATCTYNPPNSNSNPGNSVSSIGNTNAPFRGTDWSKPYFCQNGSWFLEGVFPNVHPTAEAKLDLWIDNMEYFANIFGSLGTVNWVGQGGSFVDHRTTPSYHRTGEAIDLKFIKWPNAKNTKACNGPYDTSPSKPKRHRRYLAVEASLRKYFGYVLNTYIPDHDNHFHVDNGCPAGLAINWGSSLRQYKSVAYFIQDCCIMFNNASITLDGIWGSQTDNAFDDLLDVLNLDCTDPKNSLSDYRLFLDYVQMHGFKNKLAGYYTYSCGGPL